MEMAMSLAWMYDQRAAKIADTNKSAASKPPIRMLPLKAPPSTPPTLASIGAPPAVPPRPFKPLTIEEMTERHRAGLCFNCDEPFTRGHKCRHLFNITAIMAINVAGIRRLIKIEVWFV